MSRTSKRRRTTGYGPAADEHEALYCRLTRLERLRVLEMLLVDQVAYPSDGDQTDRDIAEAWRLIGDAVVREDASYGEWRAARGLPLE